LTDVGKAEGAEKKDGGAAHQVAAEHDFGGGGGQAAGGALVRGALRTAIKASGHRVVVRESGNDRRGGQRCGRTPRGHGNSIERGAWRARGEGKLRGRGGFTSGGFAASGGLGLRGGERGDQILVTLVVLLLADSDGDGHSAAGLDTLDAAIHFYGMIESEVRGETGADPERVGGLDEHAVGADVARFSAKNGGAPFDFEVGAKGITRRPAALVAPGRMLPTGHRAGAPPAKDPKVRRRGERAAHC